MIEACNFNLTRHTDSSILSLNQAISMSNVCQQLIYDFLLLSALRYKNCCGKGGLNAAVNGSNVIATVELYLYDYWICGIRLFDQLIELVVDGDTNDDDCWEELVTNCCSSNYLLHVWHWNWSVKEIFNYSPNLMAHCLQSRSNNKNVWESQVCRQLHD